MSRPLALLVLLSACAEPEPTWHQDVQPIVAGRCVACHSEGGIGPFPLGRYEDVLPVAALVADAVGSRKMPPWRASGAQHYLNDPSLDDAQIAAIRGWVDAGMPEGDPEAPGEPLPPVATALAHVDATIGMAEAYAPVGDPDDYRCFVVDWEPTDTVYVTGFRPRPGNDRVVHHVAAFLIRPDTIVGESVFDTLAQWDEDVEGPGYTCFGGPGGSSDLQVPVQQIAQWVPGGGAVVLPEGTGIEVPPGSKVVLQVHYHVRGQGEVDQTEVDLQLAPTVERKGAFAPWLDATWPLGGMDIPAGGQATHEKEGDPRAFWPLMTGELDLADGFEIHAAMLHLHRIGASGRTWLKRADGAEVPILEVPAWDFDWQLTYQLAEPLRFANGDELGVSCTFDNASGTEDVSWGEGSDDEMCVSNLYISEL